MRTRTWCVAGVLVCLAAPAMGQTVLSESEALARLSPDSPRVRAIRSSIALARADVLSAGRWPNPRLTFNRESVAGVTENIVTVALPLPITGRRALEVSAAAALGDAVERRTDDALRQARLELRSAYADLASAQVREVELSRARERLQELAMVLARREQAGDAAGYDRMRAERELADLEADWSSSRADRARAQARLGAFFAGIDSTSLIVAVPAGGDRPALPAVDALVARARTGRGEALALQRELEAARFAERASGRRPIPEPEVVAGSKSSTAGRGDIGSVISVHASIPLFDRGRPEAAAARARAAQAEARLADFNATVASQISALRALAIERRDTADRYRRATDNAAALERIAQVSYDAGERGILELLDAYRAGAAARARQASLDAAARQAELELEFVSGWEVQ